MFFILLDIYIYIYNFKIKFIGMKELNHFWNSNLTKELNHFWHSNLTRTRTSTHRHIAAIPKPGYWILPPILPEPAHSCSLGSKSSLVPLTSALAGLSLFRPTCQPQRRFLYTRQGAAPSSLINLEYHYRRRRPPDRSIVFAKLVTKYNRRCRTIPQRTI
jgi:hypothetical protein